VDALRPVSTERKCRICRSPKRAEVEALLSRLGETDDVYGVLTLDRIAKTILPALDGGGPSSASGLKRHRRLHAEGASSPVEPAWAENDELQALIAEVGEMAAQHRVSPAALLNLQQRLYLLDLRRRLARGESVAVTADAAARAAAQLQKTEREAEEGEFLRVLAMGIEQSFRGKIGGAEPTCELIEGELVEDAEVVKYVEQRAASDALACSEHAALGI
jgi:hypothetical protein